MNVLVICKRTYPKEKACIIDMLCYLFMLNNMKIHVITWYVPNSEFNLHRTCKFCSTYKLQYTHCFFWAKTVKILPNMFRIFFSLLVYHLTIFDPLKLVCTIFYQIFIFDQVIALQKLWKMFFISSKKLYSFSRYSDFCILGFPSFFSMSAIALEVDPTKILKFMTSSTI